MKSKLLAILLFTFNLILCQQYICYNSCILARNGICEDINNICIYGSDCADCGPRQMETAKPTSTSVPTTYPTYFQINDTGEWPPAGSWAPTTKRPSTMKRKKRRRHRKK